MKYNINVPFAVIGGSQAYDLLQRGSIQGKRVGEIETPFGHSQPVYHIHNSDIEMLFLSRHGEKGYSLTAPFVNYRANIYALKELGVKQIVSWSGPVQLIRPTTLANTLLLMISWMRHTAGNPPFIKIVV